MAKKFGKFLLGAAIIGGAAAATYIYLQKKGKVFVTPENTDEDYDDFSEETVECPTRNYVSLEPVFTEGNPDEAIVVPEETTEPDAIEEFFDEEKTEE